MSHAANPSQQVFIIFFVGRAGDDIAMKDFKLFTGCSLQIGLVVFLFLVLPLSGISHAAILELRTGQKVEGDYLGGSEIEIKMKVGSQIISFPMSDVVRLDISVKQPKSEFASDSLRALRVLQGLQSVTRAGVNFTEYKKRTLDATVEIDAFYKKYTSGCKNEPLGKCLSTKADVVLGSSSAMEFYNMAAKAWSAHIEGIPNHVLDVQFMLLGCPSLGEHLVVRKEDEGRALLRAYLLDKEGLPYVWTCAIDQIEKIEKSLSQSSSAE